MGKIVQLLGFLSIMTLLTACLKRPDCSVTPLVEQDFNVSQLGSIDTLEQGEVLWFYGNLVLPNLQNRRTIEKSLPYPPGIRLQFYEVAFILPIDSLIHPIPGEPHTFSTIRPFVLHSQNGRSTYTDHMNASIDGLMTKDSVLMTWGLEAKKPGLYRIKIAKKGVSDILLDHRTEECPVSWRYNFKFPGNQDIDDFAAMYFGLSNMDRRMNYLVYVRE